jgi:hypothetical protein
MKYVFIGLIAFFVLYAGVLVTTKKGKIDDSAAIRRYVKSRGAAPVPVTWRGKIGEGI